ncbi:TPT-domain-containing protein [Meredithblackwellia eburnea MCA 4105]
MTAAYLAREEPPRYRQVYPLPHTPGDRTPSSSIDDVKDSQIVSPYNEHSSLHNHHHHHHQQYQQQPPSYRARSPFRDNDDATLSKFLHNAFLSAKQTTGSLLTPSSSDLSLPYLSSFLQQSQPQQTNSNQQNLNSSSQQLPKEQQHSLNIKLPSASTIGFIFLCGLWYLSSALSSNTGKSILTRFRYPVTLTFVQFAFVAAYCVVILAARERLGSMTGTVANNFGRRASIGTAPGWGIKKPSKTMFHGTLMMSLFQIAGHVFSSMAIARVPVSTVHTIKALSPLFTVMSYAALFKVRYSSATYTALIPLTLGVMLACSFDLRANAIGFLCALGSTVIFVSQNIFSKKLLPKESPNGGALPSGGGGSSAGSGSGAKLDKLNLLFYSSGMAFVLMIPIWLYSDGGALWAAWMQTAPPASHSTSKAATSTGSSLTFYFFLNGTVHFGQNLIAFSLLARTSPVTYSIASLIKRIAVICIAIVWSGQAVSFVQAFGMTMTFGGLWLYNRAKGSVEQGERKRVQVEKRSEMLLPTSADDARVLDGASTPTGPPPRPSYFHPQGSQPMPQPPPPPPPPHSHVHSSHPHLHTHQHLPPLKIHPGQQAPPPPPPQQQQQHQHQHGGGVPGGGGGGVAQGIITSPVLVSSGVEAHVGAGTGVGSDFNPSRPQHRGSVGNLHHHQSPTHVVASGIGRP